MIVEAAFTIVFQKEGKGVELAAVVEVPAQEEFVPFPRGRRLRANQGLHPFLPSWAPVLGNDLLGSWTERVRKLGMKSLWLTSSLQEDGRFHSALTSFARKGVERILLIRLKSYAEMDLADLVRFHCEGRNRWTEAHDVRGQLGISLLDGLALYGGDTGEPCSTSADKRTSSGRTWYQFNGYAKRIFSARERQELVGDALTGACAMRPLGREVQDKVWVAEGARVDSSARLIGPAYIGARCIIGAGATIGPFASVEHDCQIDCGTTVEQSTILPYTYLSPGLLVRRAQVDGGRMETFDRDAVADLGPAGLASRMPRAKSFRYASWGPAIGDLSRRAIRFWRNSPSPATLSHSWREVQL